MFSWKWLYEQAGWKDLQDSTKVELSITEKARKERKGKMEGVSRAVIKPPQCQNSKKKKKKKKDETSQG